MAVTLTDPKSAPLSHEKYVSCEVFSEQTGLDMDDIKASFATNYEGKLVVPVFMLSQTSPTVHPELATEHGSETQKCNQTKHQPSNPSNGHKKNE